MKIVQSLWTNPHRRKNDTNKHARKEEGGWTHKKYNYLSWILSCMKLKSFYNEVELVTDTKGASLLVDKLKLPYTSVDCSMENIKDFDLDLWALGKIHAYSKQNNPFLHVDGDVFIWEKFDENIATAQLTCQHIEIDAAIYGEILEVVYETFDYVPEYLRNIDTNNFVPAANAGVFGGVNLSFFKEYIEEVHRFISKNKKQINNLEKGFYHLFNCVYEQCLFYFLAEAKNIPISPVFKGNLTQRDMTFYFDDVPKKTNYVHSFGVSKKDPWMYKYLELTVKNTYPEQYYNLINLLETNKL